MPTRSAVLATLADNTTGDISAADLRAAIEGAWDEATYKPEDYGAVRDGVTDDSAAFQAMMLDVKAAIRAGTNSSSADPQGTATIALSGGDYYLRNPGAFMGDETMVQKAYGVTYVGRGSGVTNVVFDPVSAGTLMANDWWQGIRMYGIKFVAKIAGCTFMQSYTTHSAQDYSFTDVKWKGFKYAFDLQGDNNNSEYKFFGCGSDNIETGGAFLYVGTASTSDQFLNYWFYGFKHWSTSAPLIDAAKGGHFHFFGLDVSDFASGEASTYRPVFALRGNSHAQGVCSMYVSAMRFEGKSTYSQVMFSEWPGGTVTFDSLDLTSQGLTYAYDRAFFIDYQNVNGPIYSINNMVAVQATMRVAIRSNDWAYRHRIHFTDCKWGSAVRSPSEVVVYDVSLAAGNNVYPEVEFTGCTGGVTNPSTATGAGVWDATMGWNGERVHNMQKRQVSIRTGSGAPWNSSTQYLALPVGALITGITAMMPAGATGSGITTATWQLSTTEGTPTVLATTPATPGALSAGFNVHAELAVPFLADTTDKATVKIVPSNADVTTRNGLLLVEGYW